MASKSGWESSVDEEDICCEGLFVVVVVVVLRRGVVVEESFGVVSNCWNALDWEELV